jgi:hypothetical protein
VVVTCDDCPSWREHRPNKLTAAQARLDHEHRVHAEYRGNGAQSVYRTTRTAGRR